MPGCIILATPNASGQIKKMQSANRLRQALHRGQGASFGAWLTMPGTNFARTVARCGFDWLCVDTEHGNIDDGAMHETVSSIAACGVSPIVRIAANEGWMVKRALDAGAHGLVVPLLNSAEEARKLVAAAKFPPAGIRGYGSPFVTGPFGLESTTQYLQQANESLLTIVQIETKAALDDVEAIAAVEGVDVLFIGPFDLGNSLGHPILDGTIHDELQKAIARIQKATVAKGKKTAIFATSGEQARVYADQGFDMISVALDVDIITSSFKTALNAAKGD